MRRNQYDLRRWTESSSGFNHAYWHLPSCRYSACSYQCVLLWLRPCPLQSFLEITSQMVPRRATVAETTSVEGGSIQHTRTYGKFTKYMKCEKQKKTGRGSLPTWTLGEAQGPEGDSNNPSTELWPDKDVFSPSQHSLSKHPTS